MISLIDDFNQVDMLGAPQKIIEIYKDVPEINEIDNRGFPICRPLFSHSSLPIELGLESVRIENFDFKSSFLYSVYVHHNQKLWPKHIDLIPSQVLESIRSDNGFLLLDNTLEGNRINDDWLIKPLYESLEKLNLPIEKIIFVTNNLLAEREHNSWFKSQKRYNKKIKLISFMWNVHDVNRLIKTKNLPSKVDIQGEIDYKSKKVNSIKHFLKVNRTNRPERNTFMLFMNHHKLFDKSLISFPDLPDNHMLEHYPARLDKYLSDKNKKSLRSKVPFNIDITDENNQGPAGHGKGFFDADLPFQPIHYKNSFISIVMGAFPYEIEACHLHSSTFNPIYCGQPIIQFAPFQSLQEMRNRGFKTFSKWWDEGYDNQTEGWKRLDMIMNLVLELSELSNGEMLEMYIDMKDVLQHNVDLISAYNIDTELYKRIFIND